MIPLKLDELKKLHQKKFRDENRIFLAEGEHLILELVRALPHTPALAATQLLLTHEYESEHSVPTWLDAPAVQRLSARQMAAISDTRTPQGIVAIVPIAAPPPPRANERIIYLHEVQDPGNLGTILRTLAWFGNFRCLLSPQSVDLYNPKVVRASMGAIFHVPVERDVTFESLHARYPRLALLDLHGAPLSSPNFRAFDAYVFGNEARGLPAELNKPLRSTTFSIPGGRTIESLNLATAVNICAYELMRD